MHIYNFMKTRNSLRFVLAAALFATSLAIMPQTEAFAQNASGKKDADKIYSYVEEMPAFEGGTEGMLKFLSSNIQYPSEAQAAGLEGLVVMSFVVETDGSISDIQTVKKLGRGTDEEAARVVQLMNGKWSIGKQKGNPVRVRYTLPVRFTLNASDRAATADIANRAPNFKGGSEAMIQTISSYLALPEEAKKENLNARVMVKFYIDKDGSVSNIRLEGTKLKKVVGPDSELDYMDASTFKLADKALLVKLSEAAMAAVKATSGKWEPATRNAQPVHAEVVLPIQFIGAKGSATEKQIATPTVTKYVKAYYTYKDGSFEKFLAKNLRYPANAAYEGILKASITINADGSISGPSLSPTSNFSKEEFIVYKELERVAKLMEGKWIPGKVDGQPVTVSKTFTIQFVVKDGTAKPVDKDAPKADVVVTKQK